MTIARVRTKPYKYHKPHICGTSYGRVTWPPPGYWRQNATYACPGSMNYNTYWIESTAYCADETHPGPPWKDGGPLFLKKWYNPIFHTRNVDIVSSNGLDRYVGCFYHQYPPGGIGTEYPALSRQTDLGTKWGATGWNKFRPTRSKANLAQFIGELREFKTLFRGRLRDFKDLGSAYLNYKFGWRPFVKDILDFYNALQKVERTIDYIRRNNNRWITRGGTLLRTEDTAYSTDLGNCVRPYLPYHFHSTIPTSASHTLITPRTEERIWFKARMKYYIPGLKVDRCKDVVSSPLLRKIYGLEVTPALVWELTPWSWLADWFGNVGDILENISSQTYDNLVAKYAYVMRSWTKTYFLSTFYKFASQSMPGIQLYSSWVLSTKQREEAGSPYGFHLGWDDLSPYQASILFALGLAKLT